MDINSSGSLSLHKTTQESKDLLKKILSEVSPDIDKKKFNLIYKEHISWYKKQNPNEVYEVSDKNVYDHLMANSIIVKLWTPRHSSKGTVIGHKVEISLDKSREYLRYLVCGNYKLDTQTKILETVERPKKTFPLSGGYFGLTQLFMENKKIPINYEHIKQVYTGSNEPILDMIPSDINTYIGELKKRTPFGKSNFIAKDNTYTFIP